MAASSLTLNTSGLSQATLGGSDIQYSYCINNIVKQQGSYSVPQLVKLNDIHAISADYQPEDFRPDEFIKSLNSMPSEDFNRIASSLKLDDICQEFSKARQDISVSSLSVQDKEKLVHAVIGVQQRLYDFAIDKLEGEAKSLYLKTMTIDSDAPAFHNHAADILTRGELSDAQKERVEHLVIRYGLGQNMIKSDRDRCLAAFFCGNGKNYSQMLEKWTDRCLGSQPWNSDWPRRPLVGAWLEHAHRCAYAPLTDSLTDKLTQAITAHSPLIATKIETGFKGLIPGHDWGKLFPGDNKPATFKIENIESAENGVKDVTQASALKLKFSFPAEGDKELPTLFTPGQHLAIMNLSQTPDSFKESLSKEYEKTLDKPEFQHVIDDLKSSKFRYYTIESKEGGNDDGTLSIYLRVQKDDPESNSIYLSGLKKGDTGLAGFPATDFTRCPKPHTPMIMFGQGTSASLANTFAKSRMLQNKNKDFWFAPSYIVMNYRNNAQRFAAPELRSAAQFSRFNSKFRALISEGDRWRPHIQKSDSNSILAGIKNICENGFKVPKRVKGSELGFRLLKERNEFDLVKSLIINPDTHYTFSGFLGVAEDVIDHVKSVAQTRNIPLEVIENAIIMAKQEGRFHVEGSVARDMPTHYQGT